MTLRPHNAPYITEDDVPVASNIQFNMAPDNITLNPKVDYNTAESSFKVLTDFDENQPFETIDYLNLFSELYRVVFYKDYKKNDNYLMDSLLAFGRDPKIYRSDFTIKCEVFTQSSSRDGINIKKTSDGHYFVDINPNWVDVIRGIRSDVDFCLQINKERTDRRFFATYNINDIEIFFGNTVPEVIHLEIDCSILVNKIRDFIKSENSFFSLDGKTYKLMR